MKNEYRKIMKNLPDYYNVTSEIKSITEYQILIILKLFLEKDKEREGRLSYEEMLKILNELKFKASAKEVETILRSEFEDLNENIEKEKISFNTLVKVCDILKREKLVLVQLGNNLNYMIFLMLLGLIVIYISYFYSYKDS